MLKVKQSPRCTAVKHDRNENGRQENELVMREEYCSHVTKDKENVPLPIMYQQPGPLPWSARAARAASCIFACSVNSLKQFYMESRQESLQLKVPPNGKFLSTSRKDLFSIQNLSGLRYFFLRIL